MEFILLSTVVTRVQEVAKKEGDDPSTVSELDSQQTKAIADLPRPAVQKRIISGLYPIYASRSMGEMVRTVADGYRGGYSELLLSSSLLLSTGPMMHKASVILIKW